MKETMEILGVNIDVTNLPDAVRTIEEWIESRYKTYVCIAPVATIMDCQRDKDYMKVINMAGMATPDGMPLVWTGRLRGKHKINRTYGPDLMNALCDISLDKGYRHYFYGGTKEANEILVKNLKERFPGLIVAGHYAPPFRSGNNREDGQVLEEINNSRADILWVGLGSPKQDYWMYHHREQLNVPVMVGVGAAFDYMAGIKKQAPRWMQRTGLEWFFRLCSEPKRLWKRYMFGNSKFIYLLFQDWIHRNLTKGKA